jgi:hypothetical protein
VSREPDLRLRVELGPSLPGWLVRLLPGAVVVGLSAVDNGLAVLGGTAPPGGLVGSGVVEALLLGAAALSAWRPALPTGPVVLGLLGLRVLSGPDLLAADSLGLLRLVLLLVGTHLLLRLTGLAAHTAWAGRVETAVLARWLAPVVPVQAGLGTLLAAVLAVRVAVGAPGDPGDGVTGVLRLIAVVAVVAAVLVAAPQEWFRRVRP